jgi:hypothetical protein
MPSLSQNLRETNRRLGFWLDSMVPRHEQPAITPPEHIAELLSELLRAGEWLRAEPLSPQGRDPELDRELAQYRKHVERLRDLLPMIHDQLLAERARLEAQRARVRSAAEWARASLQTV